MSFEIALSGIQAINQQLETTSNNIANAGTYGFKSSRVNFSSMYAGAQATGVEVGSMTQSIGQNGGVMTTGRGMDASIDGRGFFVSRDGQGLMAYSRVGIFSADKQGYLVDSNQRRAQGYAAVVGSAAQGAMGDIKVPTGQIPAAASTKVDYVGNLSADWAPPTVTPLNVSNKDSYNMSKQSIVYDSLGTQHTLSQYFVKTATPGQIEVYYSFDGAAPAAAPSATLSFNSVGQLTAPLAPVTLNVAAPGNGAAALAVNVGYTGTTQFAGEAITTTNSTDGYASGTFVGVELGQDGSVIAKYSNDEQQVVGTLALATFADEGSLTATSDTSWRESSASGVALYGSPGTGLSGKLNTGALERSNVDITSELVGLMTSQRNYQANSKVISTQNTMMQALMQAL
ncbi:flagellar hook protein FlgE [Massilia soli]|uniref:Flagellar hook protein FlgE n=1 Tax=Massilia soli TaxID=2792854 RepID=A0ABS7SRT5_9BURK|nr:flagellar hook-basal body complex protein [Massilia soli]MBZ2208645.1 flagellar hook-basal body complex protein [Massilia soli]